MESLRHTLRKSLLSFVTAGMLLISAHAVAVETQAGELKKQLLAYQPTNAQDAQKKAMELVPAIGKPGTPENALFAAKYRYARNLLRIATQMKERNEPGADTLFNTDAVRILQSNRWPLYFAAVVLEELEGGKLQHIRDGKATIAELVKFVAFMSPDALKSVLGPPDSTRSDELWVYHRKGIDPITEKPTILHFHLPYPENAFFEYRIEGRRETLVCEPKVTLANP